MNCRRAQTDIALWAGNDLDETDRLSLQRHVEACPDCREYQAQMQALMRLVDECPLREQADEASKSALSDSLWPSLSSHLVSLPFRNSDRFNGWIPAVAVAAVCLAMLMVASPQGTFPPNGTAVQSDAGQNNWPQEPETNMANQPASAIGPRERGPMADMQAGSERSTERSTERYGFPEWTPSERIPAFPPSFSQERELMSPDPRDFALRDLSERRRILFGPTVRLVVE